MIAKNNIELNTIEKWEKHAGPVSSKQWKEHRSAKEAAKLWLNFKSPDLPDEIEDALSNNKNFGKIRSWKGEPEVKVKFDTFHGPSNMDLIINVRDELGDFVMGIEAKADEPLGNYVKDIFTDALERKIKNEASRGIDRVEHLAKSLFIDRGSHQTKVGDLRYQMMTGIAATITAAINNKCQRALFVIQEFHTESTEYEKLNINKRDIDLFIKRLSNGDIEEVETNKIYGPISIPGLPLFDEIPDLFFLKVVHSD